MENLATLQNVAIILGLAALGGLTMAIMRFSGTPRPPDWMPIGHGLVAATGVVLLAIVVMGGGDVPSKAKYALGLFVLAALGGLTINLRFHRKGLPLPIPFVIGHGSIAVIGYVLLLMAIFAS